MESAWTFSVGELLLGACLGLNLLCLYLLWTRLSAQPGAAAAHLPQPREAAPPLSSTTWPQKERSRREGTAPDREEDEHRQLADSEESDCEDDLADSEENDCEDDGPPLEELSTEMEEIKACIRSIRKIADDIDKINKGWVFARIISNSMGAVSKTVNYLGSTLTPHRASASLSLTAVALGFSVGETIVSVSSSIYKKCIYSKKKEETQTLINKCREALRMMKDPNELDLCSYLATSDKKDLVKYLELTEECFPAMCDTYKMTSRFLELAKQSTAASEKTQGNTEESEKVDVKCPGKETHENIEGLRKVDEKSAGKSLTNGQIEDSFSKLLALSELWVNARAILLCCQDLSDGCKTEMAAIIRAKAKEFEEALEKLA